MRCQRLPKSALATPCRVPRQASRRFVQATRERIKVKGTHDRCDTVGEGGLGARSPPAGALHAHATVGERRAHAPSTGRTCTHTHAGRGGGGW
ncbi:hypothetical protein BU14_1334s0001 [Porphyra umbilicalis]|uniref:Uncharacterized protein n=1 Tax=Porphyra umbilicalis TaxID=2786 RepID=A0A1X6NLX6_PORUM|nr:hypothetical protein BU14_1334s0001 [Porphyra umbilicalis]|eukprot:OSX69624.1 hypothetical protein BU14_1334s0001 [Porphyra umbilicalis]